jgi:hypothetical protein
MSDKKIIRDLAMAAAIGAAALVPGAASANTEQPTETTHVVVKRDIVIAQASQSAIRKKLPAATGPGLRSKETFVKDNGPVWVNSPKLELQKNKKVLQRQSVLDIFNKNKI